MTDKVKITRAIFHLKDHPNIAPGEFLISDPDQVESVLKKHGVSYRREDEEVLVEKSATRYRTLFRID